MRGLTGWAGSIERRLPDGIDLVVLGGLLVLVCVALLFLKLADGVAGGESWHADKAILRGLREADDPTRVIGPSWAGAAVRDLTALGSGPVLTVLSLSVLGYLCLDRKTHAALLGAFSIGGGALLNPLLKLWFARPRPTVVPHLVETTSTSFPSGHSMGAAIVYLTLGAILATLLESRIKQLYVLGVAIVLTGIVGISRVVLGVHYPTDVLGGWAAGLMWAMLCYAAARWLQRRGMVETTDDESGSGPIPPPA